MNDNYWEPLLRIQIEDVAYIVNPSQDTMNLYRVNQRFHRDTLKRCLPIIEDNLVLKPLLLVGGKLFRLFITCVNQYMIDQPIITHSMCTLTCYIEDAYDKKLVHAFSMQGCVHESLGYLYQTAKKEILRRRIDMGDLYL